MNMNLDDLMKLCESVPRAPKVDAIVCHPSLAGEVSRLLRGSGMPCFGLDILPVNLRKQTRFPRSGKKRMRKKWRNNPANFSADNKIYCIRKPQWPREGIGDEMKRPEGEEAE